MSWNLFTSVVITAPKDARHAELEISIRKYSEFDTGKLAKFRRLDKLEACTLNVSAAEYRFRQFATAIALSCPALVDLNLTARTSTRRNLNFVIGVGVFTGLAYLLKGLPRLRKFRVNWCESDGEILAVVDAIKGKPKLNKIDLLVHHGLVSPSGIKLILNLLLKHQSNSHFGVSQIRSISSKVATFYDFMVEISKTLK